MVFQKCSMHCRLQSPGLVYPVSARLVWGDGWLAQIGFVDFAGTSRNSSDPMHPTPRSLPVVSV